MRLATYQHAGVESFGIVLRHPVDGADRVFNPAAVEAAAATLPTLKGAGYTWWRPAFQPGGPWPASLAEFLARGAPAMDAARRMSDFLARFLEQGDPEVFQAAGRPVSEVQLQAPIPEPRLLLGVVGNNPGFLRMDPARARNLHQPKCHQRTQTSVVGHGQPIVLPAGGEPWAGTTELGVIIGRGGREIPRESAREHIAGYTIVNDGLGSLYAHRWAGLDKAAGITGPHFHASNTASWLDKKADTMLSMGPWLVTPEEVGDPYDLLCHYREGGVTRNRAHTGALCTGIEELIHWLSRFLTLQPGMVLHLGALGQDGLPATAAGNFRREHVVECEIERVGVLRNPLVAPSVNDWRDHDDPGRVVHPSPVVRKCIAAGKAGRMSATDWCPAKARHFWTLVGNSKARDGVDVIEPRPYPLPYNAPSMALAADGAAVVLPPCAGAIEISCELGIVIGSVTHSVSVAEAPGHILGFITLAVLRDSSFHDALIAPHKLQRPMADIYSRWLEGSNVTSAIPQKVEDTRSLPTRLLVEGVGESTGSTSNYLHDPATIIAELSRGITLLPGDVIALGPSHSGVLLKSGAAIPAGTAIRATIGSVGTAVATVIDNRDIARSLLL